MARTGGYRGKGQYGTAAHTGGTLDPSMRARGVPGSVARQGPQAVLAWRQANAAAPAPGRKSAADAVAAVDALMSKRAAEIKVENAARRQAATQPATSPKAEPVAAPMNSAEDRYINRARATSDPRSDAELRAAYHRNMAALKDRQAKSAAAKADVAHLDSRIENARASLSIGKPTDADVSRTNALISDLEKQKAPAVAPTAKSAKPVSAKPSTSADVLRGLSKAQVRDVANRLGVATSRAMSSAQLRAEIESVVQSRVYQAAKMVTVQASGMGALGGDVAVAESAVSAAAKEARTRAEQDVRAAVTEAWKSSPAAPKAKTPRKPAPSQIANARYGSDFMAPDPARAAALEASARQPRAPSAARQSAIAKWNETFGVPPPKSMPTKKMVSKVDGHWRQIASMENRGNRGLARNPSADRPNVAPEQVRAQVLASRGNPTQQTNRALVPVPTAVSPSPQPGPQPGMLARAGDMYAKAAPYIGLAGLAWQAMGAYNRARDPDGVGGNKTRREALYEAGKAVAPGLAMAALATVSKTAGKLILPVTMAWSAAQGAREDQGSMLRGAVRGAVRALDPTQMFMDRGLGERAVDATLGSMPKPQAPSLWNQKLSPWQQGSAFGPPMQHGRLTDDQKRQFADANASFAVRQAQAATAKAEAAKEKGARGWANPAVQMAAQQARGVENVTDWAAQGEDFIGKQHMGMG